MRVNGKLIELSFTTSSDEEKVKIREDGWTIQEKEEALKHNINLEDYKLVKVIPGMCERGSVSKGLGTCLDGYEIIITLKTNPKFKTGDKVKIVNYGHLIWQTKQYIKKTPKNLISENENFYFVDIRPEIVGKKDLIRSVIETQGKYEYSLIHNGAWFSENQLELII